jgi:hypothetical protein
MSMLFDLINALQVMLHLLLLNQPLTANVYLFFAFLANIANFEFLENAQELTEEILGYNMREPPIEYWEYIGYESSHFAANLSSMFIFYLMIPPLLLTLAGLKFLSSYMTHPRLTEWT